jgi:hypothetical protein
MILLDEMLKLRSCNVYGRFLSKHMVPKQRLIFGGKQMHDDKSGPSCITLCIHRSTATAMAVHDHCFVVVADAAAADAPLK